MVVTLEFPVDFLLTSYIYVCIFLQKFYAYLIVLIILSSLTIYAFIKRWQRRGILKSDFCFSVLLNAHVVALSAQELKSESMTRFRKRDKALFYGRKMLRKVKNISGQVRNSGTGRKRKMVMKFARRILQLKKETDSEQLKVT